MDERMRFVIRLKDGESMTSVCREFGISRKTGYKIFERYEDCGLEGLSDRTRRPVRYANQLPEQIEAAIVAAKREKPRWGARKIRERLLRSMTSWKSLTINGLTRRFRCSFQLRYISLRPGPTRAYPNRITRSTTGR